MFFAVDFNDEDPAGQRLYRPRDLELVQRIKALLYDERLTLEGAKKRLLSESRKTNQQLDLGLRETSYADTLRRILPARLPAHGSLEGCDCAGALVLDFRDHGG